MIRIDKNEKLNEFTFCKSGRVYTFEELAIMAKEFAKEIVDNKEENFAILGF